MQKQSLRQRILQSFFSIFCVTTQLKRDKIRVDYSVWFQFYKLANQNATIFCAAKQIASCIITFILKRLAIFSYLLRKTNLADFLANQMSMKRGSFYFDILWYRILDEFICIHRGWWQCWDNLCHGVLETISIHAFLNVFINLSIVWFSSNCRDKQIQEMCKETFQFIAPLHLCCLC